MSRGNAVDDPSSHHFASQFRRRPVAQRQPAVLGLLAGHGDDRRELFGREPCRCSRSRQVRQGCADPLGQVSVGRRLHLGRSQRLLRICPASTPLPDRTPAQLHALRLLHVAHALGARKHDGRPFRQPPRRASCLHQLQQDRTLPQRHRDAPGPSSHGGTSSRVPSLHARPMANFWVHNLRRAGLGACPGGACPWP
jgi:hypothetical protein